MVLFALITLVWLFAGLHLAFGSEWMIIVFTILDAILVSFFQNRHVSNLTTGGQLEDNCVFITF